MKARNFVNSAKVDTTWNKALSFCEDVWKHPNNWSKLKTILYFVEVEKTSTCSLVFRMNFTCKKLEVLWVCKPLNFIEIFVKPVCSFKFSISSWNWNRKNWENKHWFANAISLFANNIGVIFWKQSLHLHKAGGRVRTHCPTLTSLVGLHGYVFYSKILMVRRYHSCIYVFCS